MPVSERKGKGNIPHVFLAQGASGSLIKIAHTVTDAHGDEGTSRITASDNDPSSILVQPVSKASIERWNRPDAFQKFLRREAERERALRAPQMTLDQTFDENQDIQSSPLVPSSDGVDIPSLTSGDEFESDDNSIYSTKSDSILYPFALSAVTPFPTNPLHRKRVERLRRRIEKLTRSGMRDMLSSDEEDKEKKSRKKAAEEVGGDRKAKSGAAPSKRMKVIERMKGRTKKGATASGVAQFDVGSPADGWDPFGDEAELCV